VRETILLNHDENTVSVENEERTRFLFDILKKINIPVDEFWSGNLNLSVEERIKLREILLTYNIEVHTDLEGYMQIFCDNQIIAEWFKPKYILRKDLRYLDPKKRLYLEMEVDHNSIFDE